MTRAGMGVGGPIGRPRRPRHGWIVGAAIVCVAWGSVALGQQERKRRAQPRPQPRRTAPPVRRVAVRGWEGVTAHGFAVAEESAREDALVRLAQRVGLLRISAARRVAEFVSTSPVVGEKLRRRYPGVAFSSPGYSADQICSVRASVSLADVIARLKALNNQHGDGRFRGRDFDRIAMLNPVETLVVVGQGVPSLGDVPRLGRRRVVGIVPSWSGLTHGEVGHGRAPATQRGTVAGKLMAARRARADARGKLAEYARGLPLPGGHGATVGRHIDRRPGLSVSFQVWLGQARTVHTRWKIDGSAVVEIEAHLRPLWEMVAAHRGRRPLEEPRRTPVKRSRERKGRSPSRR